MIARDAATWVAASVAAAFALAAFGVGATHAWKNDGDVDMKSRAAEYALFREGHYPHPELDPPPATVRRRFTVYPPYAMVEFVPFFEPGGVIQGRLMIEGLSAGALVVMGAWAWRRVRPLGASAAALAAVSGAAIAGNGNAIAMGQFSVICMGLVAWMMSLLDRGRPLAAGVCFALAMIKPQIALVFAPLFFRRGAVRGLVAGTTILAALSLAACAWTGVSPESMVSFWTVRSDLSFHGHGTLQRFYERSLGLSQRSVVGAGLGIVAVAAAWVFARASRVRSFDPLSLAAFLAAAGRLVFYHRHYDNVMLWPLLLAVGERAMTRARPADAALALVTAATLFVPERFLDGIVWAQPLRAAVWAIAAIVVRPRFGGDRQGLTSDGGTR